MLTLHNPPETGAPAAYAQGVRVAGAQTVLFISGQVGMEPDGTIPNHIEAQLELCWKRIFAVLADASLFRENIVKTTVYLTHADYIGPHRKVRDRMLEQHVAASTMVVVGGLASPDLKCEIEAIAAA